MSNRSATLLVIALGFMLIGCGQSKSSKSATSTNNAQPSTSSSSTNNTTKVVSKSDPKPTVGDSKNEPEVSINNGGTANSGNDTTKPVVRPVPVESKGLSVGFQGLTVQQLLDKQQQESAAKAETGADNVSADSTNNGTSSSNSDETPAKTLPSRISLPVQLQAGLPAAGADMIVNFDATLLKFAGFRAGKGATAAQKTVLANVIAPGKAKLLIMGINQNIIRSTDPVAWIDFDVINTNSSAVPAITLSNVTISDPSGQRVSGN